MLKYRAAMARARQFSIRLSFVVSVMLNLFQHPLSSLVRGWTMDPETSSG
jgi:hypothetical protein